MADAPKIIQDEFSIARGSAVFRLVWTPPITTEDKADLLDWLKLVERRIARLPDDSADRVAAFGKPAPSQEDAGSGSLVGHPGDADAEVDATLSPSLNEGKAKENGNG